MSRTVKKTRRAARRSTKWTHRRATRRTTRRVRRDSRASRARGYTRRASRASRARGYTRRATRRASRSSRRSVRRKTRKNKASMKGGVVDTEFILDIYYHYTGTQYTTIEGNQVIINYDASTDTLRLNPQLTPGSNAGDTMRFQRSQKSVSISHNTIIEYTAPVEIQVGENVDVWLNTHQCWARGTIGDDGTKYVRWEGGTKPERDRDRERARENALLKWGSHGLETYPSGAKPLSKILTSQIRRVVDNRELVDITDKLGRPAELAAAQAEVARLTDLAAAQVGDRAKKVARLTELAKAEVTRLTALGIFSNDEQSEAEKRKAILETQVREAEAAPWPRYTIYETNNRDEKLVIQPRSGQGMIYPFNKFAGIIWLFRTSALYFTHVENQRGLKIIAPDIDRKGVLKDVRRAEEVGTTHYSNEEGNSSNCTELCQIERPEAVASLPSLSVISKGSLLSNPAKLGGMKLDMEEKECIELCESLMIYVEDGEVRPYKTREGEIQRYCQGFQQFISRNLLDKYMNDTNAIRLMKYVNNVVLPPGWYDHDGLHTVEIEGRAVIGLVRELLRKQGIEVEDGIGSYLDPGESIGTKVVTFCKRIYTTFGTDDTDHFKEWFNQLIFGVKLSEDKRRRLIEESELLSETPGKEVLLARDIKELKTILEEYEGEGTSAEVTDKNDYVRRIMVHNHESVRGRVWKDFDYLEGATNLNRLTSCIANSVALYLATNSQSWSDAKPVDMPFVMNTLAQSMNVGNIPCVPMQDINDTLLNELRQALFDRKRNALSPEAAAVPETDAEVEAGTAVEHVADALAVDPTAASSAVPEAVPEAPAGGTDLIAATNAAAERASDLRSIRGAYSANAHSALLAARRAHQAGVTTSPAGTTDLIADPPRLAGSYEEMMADEDADIMKEMADIIAAEEKGRLREEEEAQQAADVLEAETPAKEMFPEQAQAEARSGSERVVAFTPELFPELGGENVKRTIESGSASDIDSLVQALETDPKDNEKIGTLLDAIREDERNMEPRTRLLDVLRKTKSYFHPWETLESGMPVTQARESAAQVKAGILLSQNRENARVAAEQAKDKEVFDASAVRLEQKQERIRAEKQEGKHFKSLGKWPPLDPALWDPEE
jgi:hypothetical protein